MTDDKDVNGFYCRHLQVGGSFIPMAVCRRCGVSIVSTPNEDFDALGLHIAFHERLDALEKSYDGGP